MDERVGRAFTAPGDEAQRVFAASSAVSCLPQGRVGADSEQLGALIRPDEMRVLAHRAGYTRMDVAPIERPVWRCYRLTP